MIRRIYNFILTLSSLSIFIIVYIVKSHQWIPKLGMWSIIVYLFGVFLIAWLCLITSNKLSHDSIEKIQSIEIVSEGYMSVYLGYFFVATGIENKDYSTAVFIFGLLFLFVYFSQVQYFNPIFLLFGYRFYKIFSSEKGQNILIISKRKIRDTNDLQFMQLRRINDFTFIDKEK